MDLKLVEMWVGWKAVLSAEKKAGRMAAESVEQWVGMMAGPMALRRVVTWVGKLDERMVVRTVRRKAVEWVGTTVDSWAW